jgi:hypothetical protein
VEYAGKIMFQCLLFLLVVIFIATSKVIYLPRCFAKAVSSLGTCPTCRLELTTKDLIEVEAETDYLDL